MKIIVVGAGLSGLACAYRLQEAGHEAVVLEAGDVPGGRCATLRRDGFVIDTGPEIIAASYRHYLRLAREVGLADNFVASSPVIGAVRHGRVHDTDSTARIKMIFTPLLSWRAKFRLLAGIARNWRLISRLDAFGMANFAEHDDPLNTADAKARRMFGDEVADYLIDPMVRMIGGASASNISQLLMLGGLQSWSSALCSLQGGLDIFPKMLAAKLNVVYGADVSKVHEESDCVTVTYSDRNGDTQIMQADRCVAACTIDTAARISQTLKSVCGSFLQQLHLLKLIDVKLAYSAATNSKAFACMVPTRENRNLLLYSLSHNKAPDRAPAGSSLFTLYTADEVFIEFSGKTDDALIAWAREQMELLYPEIRGKFLFGHVARYACAGYRADPGYFQRMAALIAALPGNSRVQLAGDVYGAGSMEAAVMWGEHAAENILDAAAA